MAAGCGLIGSQTVVRFIFYDQRMVHVYQAAGWTVISTRNIPRNHEPYAGRTRECGMLIGRYPDPCESTAELKKITSRVVDIIRD